jgi:hypothetical protein
MLRCNYQSLQLLQLDFTYSPGINFLSYNNKSYVIKLRTFNSKVFKIHTLNSPQFLVTVTLRATRVLVWQKLNFFCRALRLFNSIFVHLILSNTVVTFGVNDRSVENDILYRHISTFVNVNHPNIIFIQDLRTQSVKKGKVFPLHAMMACRWKRGVVPFIRNIDGGQRLTSCPG